MTISGRPAIGIDEMHMADLATALTGGIGDADFLDIHMKQVGQKFDISGGNSVEQMQP